MDNKLNFVKNESYIYIYCVKYGVKKDNNNEIIQYVDYMVWDKPSSTFRSVSDAKVEDIAVLIKIKFLTCFTGKKGGGNYLLNWVDVIGCEKKDGDYYIRTSPNETKKDNFSFLKYAKDNGYATKIELPL